MGSSQHIYVGKYLWEVLMRAYEKRGIRYEQAEGVFVYYM